MRTPVTRAAATVAAVGDPDLAAALLARCAPHQIAAPAVTVGAATVVALAEAGRVDAAAAAAASLRVGDDFAAVDTAVRAPQVLDALWGNPACPFAVLLRGRTNQRTRQRAMRVAAARLGVDRTDTYLFGTLDDHADLVVRIVDDADLTAARTLYPTARSLAVAAALTTPHPLPADVVARLAPLGSPAAVLARPEVDRAVVDALTGSWNGTIAICQALTDGRLDPDLVSPATEAHLDRHPGGVEATLTARARQQDAATGDRSDDTTVPLDQLDRTCVGAAVVAACTARFAGDADAWMAALALVEDWHGTAAELAAAAAALT